jgi:hypothetical protein
MTKLAIFCASFLVGLGAMFAAVSSDSGAAVAAKASPPSVQDECACGGSIYLVLVDRNYVGGRTYCTYRAHYADGSPAPWFAVYDYPGNVGC